jgi:hypothetical protein
MALAFAVTTNPLETGARAGFGLRARVRAHQ